MLRRLNAPFSLTNLLRIFANAPERILARFVFRHLGLRILAFFCACYTPLVVTKRLIVLAAVLVLLALGVYSAYWYCFVPSAGFRKKSLVAFEAVLKMGKIVMSDEATASEKEKMANLAEKAVADAHRSVLTRPDSLLDNLLAHELSGMKKFSSHVKLRTPESLSKASEDLKRISACSQSIKAWLDGTSIEPAIEMSCTSASLD